MNEQNSTPLEIQQTESLPQKSFVLPQEGESITSALTKCTYTIGKRIGEGFFSHVYHCRDVWANDLVAKVLKPMGTYDTVRTNAISEVQKLVNLRHPYVTYVFDAFEFRDTFYIITEHCSFTLEFLLRQPWFNGRVWLKPVARCVLQAVHYLHVSEYVHQDIHPGNIFSALVKNEMDPSNEKAAAFQFKVGDLGITKLKNQVSALNTRAQWILPPEVLDEKTYGPIDHRIDIYHLGLLFLQIALSKELQFSKEEILSGKPRELALQLPTPLNVAIEKMLRRHVMFRTSDAMEAWRDLRAFELGSLVAEPAALVADGLQSSICVS